MTPQTPWIERKFDFNFPIGLMPVIVERLKGTVPHLKSIVGNLPETILTAKPGGNWSIKEQIGHLYDLEELWTGRINDFLQGLDTLRAADMSNSKTNSADHNKKDLRELLGFFTHARQLLVSSVERLDAHEASLTALHPRLQKPMRLVDSLFFVAEHDDHHLSVIRRLSLQQVL